MARGRPKCVPRLAEPYPQLGRTALVTAVPYSWAEEKVLANQRDLG
jgi:hypothetical protein